MQRFLSGWRASSSRDVELPVEGPVTKVIHSADGHWLACEVAPLGSTHTQIWLVTTDPDDRDARRIDYWPTSSPEGTAQLVGWDGSQVAAILTGQDGIGNSCLINPADGTTIVLDRRSLGKLIDAWAGASLVRVGPRGYRDLIMLHGLTEIALLPSDPGSTTDAGVILDDHQPRRLRSGLDGDVMKLYHPAKTYPMNSTRGYVRALVRSDNGGEHTRLVELTVTEDGVSYHVVAERPGYDLDEFAVSDDLTTVALLWNIDGRSELQILEYADNTLSQPIPLPGPVASQLSISAGGSMVALTVQGPSTPRTVELVDPRSREWQRIDREPAGGDSSPTPQLVRMTARDGNEFTGWLYAPPGGESIGAMIYLHGGPEGQSRPEYSEIFPALLDAGVIVLAPNVRGSGGFGRSFSHADDRDLRFGAIDDVADCVRFLVDGGLAAARPNRMRGLVIRRLSDAGFADLPSRAVRCGNQHLRHERPGHVLPQHRSVDRSRGVPEVRPPDQRPRSPRPTLAAAARRDDHCAIAVWWPGATTPMCRPPSPGRCSRLSSGWGGASSA